MQADGNFFLDKLRVIENKKYWMKLLIKEENISGKSDTYFAIDIIEDIVMDNIKVADQKMVNDQNQPRPLEESYAKVSLLTKVHSIIFVLLHDLNTFDWK